MNTSIPDAKSKAHWNVPNTLTWLRIVMIPGIVVLFYLPFWWAHPAAGIGFALAGITDSLDGYYARKLGQTSRLGAFLDPVADKLIVAAALVLIVSADSRWYVVIMAIVIIGREIAVSALREWMAEIGTTRPHESIGVGQVQDHHADRRAFDAAVPTAPAWNSDLQARTGIERGRGGIDLVVDDFVFATGVAAIARQLESVAGRGSSLGGARTGAAARNVGRFKALGAFFAGFFLTPGGTALQLRVCFGRE